MKIKLADRVGKVEEYYFSKKLRQIAQMRADGHQVINLGIGSPDQQPSSRVIDRLCKESKNADYHGYQSYAGIPELKSAAASWYKRKFNVELDPTTEILPLIGSKEGIMHLSMTYLQEGDDVLVPDPGYPTYRAAAKLTGATPISYDLTKESNWWPQFEKLEDSDLCRVKMMWINYPHMPSGAKGSLMLFDRLIEFANQHEILLCHDNPYAFILNDTPESILTADGALEVAVELTSLSKTFNMAGWRIGLMSGAAERISEVLRFKSNMDSGMFKPAQLAAVEAFEQEDSWYQQINDLYRSRRLVAEAILESLGSRFDKNQVGMFLWGQVPEGYEDGYEIADEILEQSHVFITPGNIFGKNGNRYIRISLCSTEQTLEEALTRIKVLQEVKSTTS